MDYVDTNYVDVITRHFVYTRTHDIADNLTQYFVDTRRQHIVDNRTQHIADTVRNVILSTIYPASPSV